MKIAIPCVDDRGLESEVSAHFGRAQYYAFIDIEDGKIKKAEVRRSPFDEHAPGEIPEFIKQHGGDMVIAYGMGRRAMDFFKEMGIGVITGAQGKVADVVQNFISGKLDTDKDWKKHGDFGEHSH